MNKPKIRFKGFEGEWKKRRIGDICNVSTGKSNTQDKVDDGKFPFYVRSPHIEKSNKYLYDEEAVLTVGDGVGTGKVFHYVNGKYDLHQRVYRLYDFKGVNALCFYYYFSQKFYKRVMAMTAKSSVDSVRLDFISEMHLPFPSLPEQRALASYFTSLDAQIAASTSRLSSLKQIKAASLLNMFPQKGETVPRVRFKGFQGEWDSPSIEDVFEIRNGYTPSKSVESYWIGGTIPWFRMEDIRVSGGFLEDSIQHITPQAVKNNGLFEKGSIIMATTATIGVHAQLIADSLANQRFTNFSIRKSQREGIIAKYAYYAFFGIDEWAVKNTNSGGLLSVNMPLLLKQPFFVPSLPEQRAIASFFTALDAQITLHRERLEKLKQIKAACLEKMFA